MEEYSSHFFSNLMKIYTDIDSSYPDLTLRCMEDGTELKCHRVIVSASSEYFKKVFGWSKSDVLDVHNGIRGDTLDIVLKYIYSGKISLTLENVHDVLVASNFFGILQIVNQCIKFLLDNLQVDNCLEMLLLSWHLDLSELIVNIVCYVAQNFAELLNDIYRLSSIPVPLISLVLESNDLIIRNELTNIPTRPAEREKCVLDFILLYTTNLDKYSDEDIEMLLSCVKWQFLGIFDQVKYICNHFPTLLYKGWMADQVIKCFFPKHSDWYPQRQLWLSDATVDNKKAYGPRSFSCSELFWLDPVLGNQLTGESTRFKVVAKEQEYINRIDLISHMRDGCDIIGGLKVHIKSPGGDSVCHHFGISEDMGFTVHPIVLADGEHITAVSGKSEWSIDQFGFETSNSRWFGPFNRGRGSRQDLMGNLAKFRKDGMVYDLHAHKLYHSVAEAPHSRIPLDTILVGISGTRIFDQDSYDITNIRFCFRLMIPASSFFKAGEKKFEIDTMDGGELQGEIGHSEGEFDNAEDGDQISNYHELVNMYYEE